MRGDAYKGIKIFDHTLLPSRKKIETTSTFSSLMSDHSGEIGV